MTGDKPAKILNISEPELITGDSREAAVAALVEQLAQQAEEAERQAATLLDKPDVTLQEISDAVASLLGAEQLAQLTGSADESSATGGFIGALIEKGNQLLIDDAKRVLADPNATIADLNTATAGLLATERQSQLLGGEPAAQSPLMDVASQLYDKARATLINDATKVLGDPNATVKEVSDAIGTLLGAERQGQFLGSGSGSDRLSPYMNLAQQLVTKAETQWPGITTAPDIAAWTSGTTSGGTTSGGTTSGGTATGGSTGGTSGSEPTPGSEPTSGWQPAGDEGGTGDTGGDDQGSGSTDPSDASGTTPGGASDASGGLHTRVADETKHEDGSTTTVFELVDGDGNVVRTEVWTFDADGNFTGRYDSSTTDASSGEDTDDDDEDDEDEDEDENADGSGSTAYWGPDSEGGGSWSDNPRIAAIIGAGGGGGLQVEPAPVDPPEPIPGEDQGGELGPIDPNRDPSIDPIAYWGPDGEPGSGQVEGGGGAPPQPGPIDPPEPIPGEDQGGDLGPIIRGDDIDPIANPGIDSTIGVAGLGAGEVGLTGSDGSVSDVSSEMASAASHDPSIAGGDDADMDDLDIQRLTAPMSDSADALSASGADVLGLGGSEPAWKWDGMALVDMSTGQMVHPGQAANTAEPGIAATEDEPAVAEVDAPTPEFEPPLAETEPSTPALEAPAVLTEPEPPAPTPDESLESHEEPALDA